MSANLRCHPEFSSTLVIIRVLTNVQKDININSVRKFLIFLLSVSLTSVIVVLSSNSVSANHQEDVLGVASAETLSIPPTAEGPGLVLPDSPLFFLDRLKQEFRLILAFTPEQKAKIHSAEAALRLSDTPCNAVLIPETLLLANIICNAATRYPATALCIFAFCSGVNAKIRRNSCFSLSRKNKGLSGRTSPGPSAVGGIDKVSALATPKTSS